MIVKCEQCQTRFKIPDDKVTDKGVKVRCTKCQHTFRVKRDGTSADAPAAAKPEDPFERFGPSTPPSEPSEETRPGVFALGVEATRSPGLGAPLQPSFEAQASTPKAAFEAPTRIAKMPAPPPGRRPLTDAAPMPPVPSPATSSPFDFNAMQPAAPPLAAPKPFDFAALSSPPRPPAPSNAPFDPTPFDFAALGPPEVTQKAAVQIPPAAKPPPSFDPTPFDFSALPPEPTVKAQMPGPPPPKSLPPAQHFTPQPFDFSALPAEPTVKAQLPSAPPPKPAPAPSQFEPQPFDFSSLSIGDDGPPPPPPHPPASKPQPAPAPSHFEPTPFDFSSVESQGLGPPPPPPPPQRAPPPAKQSRPPAPAPISAADLPPMDFGPPPPAPSRPAPAAVTQIDVPATSDPLDDVPFSDEHLSIDRDDGMRAEPGARGSLFDMASPEAQEPVNQLTSHDDQVAVAKITLKKVTADSLSSEAAAQAEKPASTESSRSRRPRGVVAMVWNVLSAAMLLVLVGAIAAVVLNEGKIDPTQSWVKLKSMFTTPRELIAFDISNGLYDTKAGRPVFYVRGEIKNRGAKSGRVKVKAEILDGEDLIRAAEGYAGATPSPEDLFSVTTAEDLKRLSEKLAPAAQRLEPGGEAAFLVAFYEYPPDLKDFRVRVTVSPDDGKTAAR